MGRDIPTFPLDEKYLDAAGQGNLGHYPPNIQNLVVSLQNLHPQELRLFFHALFQSMSPASKQVGFAAQHQPHLTPVSLCRLLQKSCGLAFHQLSDNLLSYRFTNTDGVNIRSMLPFELPFLPQMQLHRQVLQAALPLTFHL